MEVECVGAGNQSARLVDDIAEKAKECKRAVAHVEFDLGEEPEGMKRDSDLFAGLAFHGLDEVFVALDFAPRWGPHLWVAW